MTNRLNLIDLRFVLAPFLSSPMQKREKPRLTQFMRGRKRPRKGEGERFLNHQIWEGNLPLSSLKTASLKSWRPTALAVLCDSSFSSWSELQVV